MSEEQVVEQVVPVVVSKSFQEKLIEQIKQLKEVSVKSFSEDIITFVSIIAAYEFASISYEEGAKVERWSGVHISSKRTEPGILLMYALYLISLKIIHLIAYRYDNAPPKVVVLEDDDGMEYVTQLVKEIVPQTQENNQNKGSGYSDLVQELIQNSMYSLVFMACTTSYTYVGTFNKGDRILVTIEQINYLSLWYVVANVFYAAGKLIGKMTGLNSLHHFGLTLGILVIVLEIGLAHGINTFIII